MRIIAVILPLLLPAAAFGESPAEADRLRGEVAVLLADLDSDSFAVRDRAAKRMEELVSRPEWGDILAGEFRRVLVRTDVSFEVRKRLERWRRQLPPPPAEPVGKVPPEELDKLVRQLDDDSYAVRLGAAERLDWLLGEKKLAFPLMERLKRQLAADGLSTELRRPIEAAWRRARGAWLTADPAADGPLPAVPDAQIERWLDELSNAGRPGETAERELLDLLARGDCAPRLERILKDRLSRGQTADAFARLQALLDWTKPAMVAEYWQGRRQLGEQHLLVGVPSQSPGAARPSHFDRIDDGTAHCASGNSLSPGDYPVGVAFPHPNVEGAFFHLVNLPTPRRRMAYPHLLEVDEAKRLAAISRRTLERMLDERRPLSEPELMMLACLDPVEVSRFAGRHFALVDDGSTAATGPPRWGGRPSRHGMICALLANDGTQDAGPGLVEAIGKDRFMPPTARAQYKLHLIAALAIAARDPWPKADEWLAGCIGSDEPLVEDGGEPSPAPQLGATAASILLQRRGKIPARSGLLPVGDPLLNQIPLPAYRFDGESGRKEVQQWWTSEKEAKKSP